MGLHRAFKTLAEACLLVQRLNQSHRLQGFVETCVDIADQLAGTLEDAAARVTAEGLEPQPKSGGQERLENLWNRYV